MNNWLFWSLLSVLFAGLTAVLAKVGVADVDSNLATAVRTSVVLVFVRGVALLASPAGAVPLIVSADYERKRSTGSCTLRIMSLVVLPTKNWRMRECP